MIVMSTGETPMLLVNVVLPFFATIGSDVQWPLLDKSPVVDQTMQAIQ